MTSMSRHSMYIVSGLVGRGRPATAPRQPFGTPGGMRLAVVVALAALLGPWAGPVSATPVYTAGIGNSGDRTSSSCTFTGTSGTFAVPTAVSIACSDAVSSVDASARSTTGAIGVSAHAIGSANDSVAYGTDNTNAAYSDTVVFTSSDPTQTSVTTSMNVYLHGSMNGGELGMNATLNNINVMSILLDMGPGGAQCNLGQPVPICAALTTISDPGFFNVDGILASNAVTVPLDVPVNFGFSLNEILLIAGVQSAAIDWGGTVGLPPTGDVFNLPAGFTANSSGSLIVDNGFAPVKPPATVPVPSTLFLMTTGLALLGTARRGRRGRGLT